jgi:hypothetical protein
MNANTDFAATLEQALRLLSQKVALSAELSAAAEEMRGAVRKLDEVGVAASQRRTSVLTIVPTDRLSPLGDVVGSLETLDAESRSRALQREIGASFTEQLDARAREAAKAEAKRNEARKPLEALTRRVQEVAKKFTTYPSLAERAVVLLVTDFRISRVAMSAYNRFPPWPGSRASGRVTFGSIPLVADEIRRALILPRIRNENRVDNFWPGRYGDRTFIEGPEWVDRADTDIIGELARLPGSGPSQQAVDSAVAGAQARLLAEFHKVITTIAELKALDASLGDVHQRYPDGGPVWPEEMFPEWRLRQMSRWIVLPNLHGHRVAAE